MATTKKNGKAAGAESPDARRARVRAALAGWLNQVRAFSNGMYDVAYRLAEEFKDNPDGEFARELSADAAQLFDIAVRIAAIDSVVNGVYLLPLEPVVNPLDAL